jgi:hypothetical protein
MADVISNEDGQMMLLTGLLVVIGVVVYTTLLNNIILTANMPSTGLDISKQEIRDLRSLTESDIKKAAYYSNKNLSLTETKKNNYFIDYINSYNSTLEKMYSARGASVEVVLNNVTANRATTNLTIKYSDGKVKYDDTFLVYYP